MITTAGSQLVLPRGLILLASVWLVVSWLVAMGVGAPIEASSASYTPGVRVMLLGVVIGLMVGWPLLRLSQPHTAFPIRRTLLDLVVLLALVQVVLWPLRLVTPWTPPRTAAIDATLAVWTGLAAALVASVAGTASAGPRILAMAACLGVCLVGPLAAWLCVLAGLEPGPLLHLGPPMEVSTLAAGGGAPPPAEQWRWIGLIAAADAAAWSALALALRARRSRRS